MLEETNGNGDVSQTNEEDFEKSFQADLDRAPLFTNEPTRFSSRRGSIENLLRTINTSETDDVSHRLSLDRLQEFINSEVPDSQVTQDTISPNRFNTVSARHVPVLYSNFLVQPTYQSTTPHYQSYIVPNVNYQFPQAPNVQYQYPQFVLSQPPIPQTLPYIVPSATTSISSPHITQLQATSNLPPSSASLRSHLEDLPQDVRQLFQPAPVIVSSVVQNREKTTSKPRKTTTSRKTSTKKSKSSSKSKSRSSTASVRRESENNDSQQSSNETTTPTNANGLETNASNKSDRRPRWKPDPEQKKVLEDFWSQEPYPDKATKKKLSEDLKVDEKRITSWFKHRREKEQQKGTFTYKYTPAEKFLPEQLTELEAAFNNDPYARGEFIQQLAQQLGVSDKRILNWFKHRRTRLNQQGKFEYKPRAALTTEQLTFLRGAFISNETPSSDVCAQLGEEINLKPEQVARWFSTERTKKRKRRRSDSRSSKSRKKVDGTSVVDGRESFAESEIANENNTDGGNLSSPPQNVLTEEDFSQLTEEHFDNIQLTEESGNENTHADPS